MPAITRSPTDTTVGVCDIGLPCCSHVRHGNNATHSPNVYANMLPVHRLTDKGPTNCPHSGTFESVEGSPNVFVNKLKITRISDETICNDCGKKGQHDSGSPNVFANGG